MPNILAAISSLTKLRSSAAQEARPSDDLSRILRTQDLIRLQVGSMQAVLQSLHRPRTLRDAEFRVFSQFGEDGIIQFLLREIGNVPPVFIELGVENYREANSRFLLQHNNWKGMVIDGSQENVTTIRNSDLYWRHDLTAVAAFIDRDNINELLRTNGFVGDIGLLSIDIDGNDYWVWERLDVVKPAIVVVEYNSLFGATETISIPYDPLFRRSKAHASHLYWGCSISALAHLAARRGYKFVGSNSAGNNAFFVRDDLACSVIGITAKEGYVESCFRESRNARGELTYISGCDRLKQIADMPVVNVATGATLSLSQISNV